ncbi:MAG: Na+/H+ antiporter NhaA [Bdellovibrionaceae bacterium]|nr:Na+/H+ antiporter NhaA [Bdellovibrionales bacterium]MCB9085248.1 Na+/H+ antiporter NhaA [Pseudobdellovibrionaceae bacterium]
MAGQSTPNNLVRKTLDKVTSPIQAFVKLESSSGLVLLASALFAMVFANSELLSGDYFRLINLPISLWIGSFGLDKTLLLFVNDGLMAIFFYLVGLEIKRELLSGELSTPAKASFSIFAALGGMVVPAILFVSLNPSAPQSAGWGIPMATDIAFALGVLTLFGKHVPAVLKVFLLALAIVDDLGAITIIALFYTNEIAANYLGLAGMSLFLLFLLNYAGFRNVVIGIILGIITWLCFLKSGVHATLAGVFLAFLTPAKPIAAKGSEEISKSAILDQYIHALHPWVAFLIMPVFAFFNAGVDLTGFELKALITSPVALGVIVGLVLGKPLGILLFTYFSVKLGWANRPPGVSWMNITAIGFIAGIGFTMSLFINSLAYSQPEFAMQSKIGILFASIIAAVLGSALLWASRVGKKRIAGPGPLVAD